MQRLKAKAQSAAASSKFKPYRPETETPVRLPPRNMKVNMLMDECERFLDLEKIPDGYGSRDYFAYDIGKVLRYSSKDLEGLSISMERLCEHQNFLERAGLFLSALVNASPELEFLVHTAHLPKPPERIGDRNCKSITVKGPVDWKFAELMESGKIVVEQGIYVENRTHPAFETLMITQGGRIEIYGDCGGCKFKLRGGVSLILHGDGDQIIVKERSALIRVHGKLKQLVVEIPESLEKQMERLVELDRKLGFATKIMEKELHQPFALEDIVLEYNKSGKVRTLNNVRGVKEMEFGVFRGLADVKVYHKDNAQSAATLD